MTLDIDHVSLPRDGEVANGDAVLVRDEGDLALLSVIDALGHGPGAADVARLAIEELTHAPLKGGVVSLMVRVHARLRGSRGSAALVCLIRTTGPQKYEIEGCGVGNVDMRVAKAKVPILLTPGILGMRALSPRAFRGSIAPGERLAIFSDGVSPQFLLNELKDLPPGETCRVILERCRRPHDDATVLVADLRS